MDMEAEMAYADILRTLQSSILNTNVSFTTESRKLSSSLFYGPLPINVAPRLIFTILCKLWFSILKSLATIKPLSSTERASYFLFSAQLIFTSAEWRVICICKLWHMRVNGIVISSVVKLKSRWAQSLVTEWKLFVWDCDTISTLITDSEPLRFSDLPLSNCLVHSAV